MENKVNEQSKKDSHNAVAKVFAGLLLGLAVVAVAYELENKSQKASTDQNNDRPKKPEQPEVIDVTYTEVVKNKPTFIQKVRGFFKSSFHLGAKVLNFVFLTKK